MAAGTDRDNPTIPFTTRVWRRFLARLGFRDAAFSDTDTGLVPQGSGSSSDSLRGDGTWAAAASGGITELTGDVLAGPGSGSQAATVPGLVIATDTWSGSLSGSGVTNVQELADWIDANVTV